MEVAQSEAGAHAREERSEITPDAGLALKGETAAGASMPEFSPPPQGPGLVPSGVGVSAPLDAAAMVAIASTQGTVAAKGCEEPGLNGAANEHQPPGAATGAREPRPAPRQRDSTIATGDETVTLFPRRKAGQSGREGGGPVVLKLSNLEMYFQMPLHLAAKRLGLCQTAIKKACRKLGINKWPYKEMRSPWGKEGWMGEGEGGGPGAPRAAMSGAAEGRWWTEALKGAAASPAVTGVPPPALFADRLKVEVETSEGASADVMSAVNALLSLQR